MFTLVVLLPLGLLGACLYSFSGGSGLPGNIKSVAVLPFDNETANPEIPNELHRELREAFRTRLGLREAPEGRANAIVSGKITRYEPDVPVGFSADPARATTARRRVQIAIDVEVFDPSSGRAIFRRQGLTAEGEYAERAEGEGRRQAIERLINEIIEGAQSQW
ncbi:MAG TPA: LPS assembly lipoprotein LptE [Gemmatimonadaceae bacterium]|nr:LPS assembly lipoprotein LptE [Gemmatimonadaceae bacterium]